MKRAGGLMEKICEPDNLRLAWWKAQKGKGTRKDVLLFNENLDGNLLHLGESLWEGSWRPGPFHTFTINDPKVRTISAAPFGDRVVHHAIMNILDPCFERHLVHTSCACRRKKGTSFAVKTAFHYAKSSCYFLKLDVRKYFDTISHDILLQLLSRMFKDPVLLNLLAIIIQSHETTAGKGLPIGNLTSQYFANHYLSSFDHLVKEQWQCKKYIRYMDDMLFFFNDPQLGTTCYRKSRQWLAVNRKITIKEPVSAPVVAGVPFLGFAIRKNKITLGGKTKRRFKKKSRETEKALSIGTIIEEEAARKMHASASMTLLARARNFRNTVYSGSFLGQERG